MHVHSPCPLTTAQSVIVPTRKTLNPGYASRKYVYPHMVLIFNAFSKAAFSRFEPNTNNTRKVHCRVRLVI